MDEGIIGLRDNENPEKIMETNVQKEHNVGAKPVTRAHEKELAKCAEAAKPATTAEGRQGVIVFKRGAKKVS